MFYIWIKTVQNEIKNRLFVTVFCWVRNSL